MKIQWSKLIIAVVGCQLAGAVGAIFTSPNIATWYATLAKPSFNPPNWIFGPVWTILYLMMGISAYLIWSQKKEWSHNWKALAFFDLQLGLNVLWSIIFFGMQNPGLAFVEIIILLTALAVTIIKFYKISKIAAYLLIPYFLWGCFATVLNYSIWMLN